MSNSFFCVVSQKQLQMDAERQADEDEEQEEEMTVAETYADYKPAKCKSLYRPLPCFRRGT